MHAQLPVVETALNAFQVCSHDVIVGVFYHFVY